MFAGQLLLWQFEALVSKAVGEPSVVADAHEAFGQHVQQEAAQELSGIESHGALLVAMGRVSPAEGDMFAVEAEQAVVGNSDAVCVAAEITQHVCGSAERRLGIDDPLLMAQLIDQCCELSAMLELSGRAA